MIVTSDFFHFAGNFVDNWQSVFVHFGLDAGLQKHAMQNRKAKIL
jgi:hypothetical protein